MAKLKAPPVLGRIMTGDSENRKIKSLERAQLIIEYLRQADKATLTEIADSINLNPGSTYTYLSTLQSMGFIIKNNKEYRLGPELITLGEYVRNQSNLYQAAKKQVDKLAEETGEAVHLMIESNGRGIALYEKLGTEAVGTDYHQRLRQQAHQHLHCTASGKAILACLSDQQVNNILDKQELKALTPNTITNKSVLFEELERVQERGYAINDEEEVLGIAAIGSSVCDQDGTVLGSIAVSTPKSRMEQEGFEEELIEKVKRASNVSEVNVQTDDLL